MSIQASKCTLAFLQKHRPSNSSNFSSIALIWPRSQPDLIAFRLLDDEIFIFLIGPAKRVFRVHVSAFKRISEPLAYMMTNGKMKESLEKEAVLDDIEPIAFAHLAKFAYFGFSGAAGLTNANASASANAKPVPTTPTPRAYRCTLCGKRVDVPSTSSAPNWPYCDTSCRSSKIHALSSGGNYWVRCLVLNCTINDYLVGGHYDINQGWLCNRHQSQVETRHLNKNPFTYTTNQNSSTISADQFDSRTYSSKSLTHAQIRSMIGSQQSSNIDRAPQTMEHAHLYCLAHRYLVPEFPEICLNKLHRDLGLLEITDNAVAELADLLLYAYTNTRDDGDILDGSCDPLRDLIMSYISRHSAKLMKYKNFREILAAGGPPTADFMALTFAGRIKI